MKVIKALNVLARCSLFQVALLAEAFSSNG